MSKQIVPTLAVLLGLGTTSLWAQTKDAQDCNTNYFDAQIIEQSVDDDCITRTLEVKVDKANKYALSHLVIEVPCGNLTDASNTGNWRMEMNSTDPKSGKYGFKIDDIQGFGDSSTNATFTLQYTVCGSDKCSTSFAATPFDVVFKTSTCQWVQTITPNVNTAQLSATIVAKDILCNGQPTGQVSVVATAGTEPYQYLWNTGDTTAAISLVPAGIYSVTVTDATNQQISLSAEVLQPKALSVSANIAQTACNAPTGSIELTPYGGTAPYSYAWSNNDTTAKTDSLGTGMYTATITDANGCVNTRNYTIIQNTDLRATLIGSTLECHQEGSGEITSTVTGGTEPYTYNWSNGATTPTLTNQKSGRYQVTVTDSQGCTTTQSAYVSIRLLSASVSAKSPNCVGDSTGSAAISVMNGTQPYTYNWSTGDSTQTVNNLATGWYFVDITDANGCTTKRAVNISAPTPIQITPNVTGNSCEPGDSSVTVALNATGGTGPYVWEVNNLASENKFILDAPQTIQIEMTDANGCTASATAEIQYPATNVQASLSVQQPTCSSPTGSATLSVDGARLPVTAIWQDGYEGLTRNGLSAGDYLVTVTDAIGCTAPFAFHIEETTSPQVEIIEPDIKSICGTTDNKIIATVYNATQIQWFIESDSSNWGITQNNDFEATYSAGTGLATIVAVVTDQNGCQATDSTVIGCQASTDDGNTPGDGDDGSDGNDDGTDNGEGCNMEGNFTATPVNIEVDANGCLVYTLRVSTDGNSSHDLSHLVIGVDEGTLTGATVSDNWPVSINTTDPKSGVFGLKIDNIEGFGQSGADSFTVSYTVCGGNTNETHTFGVVYKAATCQWQQTVQFEGTFADQTNIDVYPNPFTDKAIIEIQPESDTQLQLHIYDLAGNKYTTLYDGAVKKGLVYKFEFKPTNKTDNLFFYQTVTPTGVKQGKILRRK